MDEMIIYSELKVYLSQKKTLQYSETYTNTFLSLLTFE